MTSRYKALTIIMWLYRILGILAVMGGILALVASVASKDGDPTTGVIALIGGIAGSIVLLGLGELFQLFMDIEENTRTNATLMRQLAKALAREK